MHDGRIRRAMQCPHVGCDAWAIAATADGTTLGAARPWACSNGHHGHRRPGTVR